MKDPTETRQTTPTPSTPTSHVEKEPDAPSYVTRQADRELVQTVLAGQYCNVLSARQMGKSSLMARAARRLRDEGARTVIIDLSAIGARLDASEWYFGIISRFKRELELEIDEAAWWLQREQLGPVQRFSDFLKVVLEEIKEPIVVFVDEIDSTLNLPFTDDFFAVIRAAYNARASDPAFKRLTFVLLGVVRPADLIKDRSRTPYNIGRSIDLQDFTLQQARALLPGLEAVSPGQAEAILELVLYWTGGHPYLTQKVCARIVAGDAGPWDEQRVDVLVQRLFFSDEAHKESNLQYVRDRVLESWEREKLLRVYRQTLDGAVADEERDPLKSQLKLVGLLKVAPGGKLAVRNRIYETVFDARWVRDAMPRLTSRRVTFVSLAVAIVAIAVAAWVLYRQQNADEIRARTYSDNFRSAASAAVRLNNLAGLFRLGDDGFADDARALFFDELSAEEQLRMFSDLDTPQQVGDDLQTVVQGLYTHLEQSAQTDDLLRVMSDAVRAIKADFPDSSILCGGLDAWLRGRSLCHAGNCQEAIPFYDQAIEYIPHNPAIYLDRAQAHARLGQHARALGDLNRVSQRYPDRRAEVGEVIRAHPALRDYLKANQGDFTALEEFAE